MKKAIALLLFITLAVCCTACSNLPWIGGNNTQVGANTDSENGKDNIIIVKDACDILTHAWEIYEDTDTDNNMYNDKFPVMGGHHQSYTLDAPASYDLDKTADLASSFCVPEELLTYVNDVATMQHMMHANTFTACAYHITETEQVEAMIEGIEKKTLDNQWLGGFPDKFFIIRIGNDYVVTAYGNKNVVDYFKDALLQVYGNIAEIPVEKNIR